MKLRPSSALVLTISLLTLGLPSAAETAWYDPAWEFAQGVTIASAVTDGDLTNFPVLISIENGTNDLFAHAQADGGDILFTAADGVTKIPHEIASYSAAAGNEVLGTWVRVPFLSSTVDTQIIMYYGNVSAGSQEDATNAWDASYVMVQHLDEAAGLHHDATANANDGTYFGTTQEADGKIGGADAFNGVDDYVGIDHHSSFNITNQITVEAWIRPLVTLTGYKRLVEKRYSTSWYFGSSATTNGLSVYINNFERAVTPDGVYGPGDWSHVAFTFDSGTDEVLLYVNGVVRGSDSYSGTIGLDTSDVRIGVWELAGWAFNGDIDEVRISDTARSTEWMAATHRIANAPAAYLSFDAETTLVALAHFEAVGLRDFIDVRWETRTEVDVEGFHLYRGEDDSEPVRITTALIPAAGSEIAGAQYEFPDREVEPAKVYTYWLEEVDVYGAATRHGPVQASLDLGCGTAAGSVPWPWAQIGGLLTLIFLVLLCRNGRRQRDLTPRR